MKELYLIECTGPSEWNNSEEACAVRWVQNMPGFLAPREYIYLREVFHDRENKIIVLVSRECDHADYPVNKKLVSTILF